MGKHMVRKDQQFGSRWEAKFKLVKAEMRGRPTPAVQRGHTHPHISPTKKKVLLVKKIESNCSFPKTGKLNDSY